MSRSTSLCLATVFLFLAYNASAITDHDDVQALQDLYKTLNSSSQLKSWKSNGGDPCGESWTGVYCNGSSVIQIIVPRLALTGYLGSQLAYLHNLTHLDMSYNSIYGNIPASLPLKITRLNLASNNLGRSIPQSLTFMKNLQHLNLSHNMLSGPIGNVFRDFTNLNEMDLSNNYLKGHLPSSFANLANLTKLYLQNNQISGSVALLAALPLSDLNIENNLFSSFIPKRFQSIQNLWIGGNNLEFERQFLGFDTTEMIVVFSIYTCVVVFYCRRDQHIHQQEGNNVNPQLEIVTNLVNTLIEEQQQIRQIVTDIHNILHHQQQQQQQAAIDQLQQFEDVAQNFVFSNGPPLQQENEMNFQEDDTVNQEAQNFDLPNYDFGLYNWVVNDQPLQPNPVPEIEEEEPDYNLIGIDALPHYEPIIELGPNNVNPPNFVDELHHAQFGDVEEHQHVDSLAVEEPPVVEEPPLANERTLSELRRSTRNIAPPQRFGYS